MRRFISIGFVHIHMFGRRANINFNACATMYAALTLEETLHSVFPLLIWSVLQGGLKAVLWTDVFQALLMYITIAAVVIKGSIDIGGAKTVWDTANEGGRLVFFK